MSGACPLRYWHSIQPWGRELERQLRDNSNRTFNDFISNSHSPSCWQWQPLAITLADFAALD
eukprot:4036307-Karenia_brevis.AAC.1